MSRLRFIVGLTRGHRRALAAGALAGLLQSAATIPVAWAVRRVFDRYLPTRDILSVAIMSGAILLFLAVSLAASVIGRRVSSRALKRVIASLREILSQRLYERPKASFETTDRFALYEVIANDVERLDSLLNALVGQLLPAVLVCLVLAAAAAYLDWQLFLGVAVMMPLLYASGRASQGRQRKVLRKFRGDFTSMGRRLMQSLRRIDLTRQQGAEPLELAAHAKAFGQVEVSGYRLVSAQFAHLRIQQLGVMALSVVILLIGGASVAYGSMTVGGLISFYAVVILLAGYLREIAAAMVPIIEGVESLDAVRVVLEADEPLPYTGTAPHVLQGTLSMERVSFAYPGSGRPILREVSVTLRAGMVGALCGPNGAGKSTLLQLLLGFYRPDSGVCTADGQPYDRIDIAGLRRQIGVVSQEPGFIEGTMRENLTYGCPDATEAEIARALHCGMAESVVTSLPQGLSTVVTEAGTPLSGGQRQRLAIARALLRKPRVLVLDEPTNHLDRDAVDGLLHTLATLSPAPSVLLISHDPHVLAKAEVVWELEGGRISPRTPILQ